MAKLIENNKACFIQLWKQLDETYKAFRRDYKRFCMRSIVRNWLPQWVTEDRLWEIYTRSELEGYEELPDPALYPRKHRMFLQALVSTYLGIGKRAVKLPELDQAYKKAFSRGAALNINKKKPVKA